ncbi:MAG: hypothetical protein A2787_06380 [Omnitrophica WOR_2 bacterium RIFCSPHIGHO2_01_FULL_48_9]|nr:MAG: hypothetical protein A3D10_02160 [Omnitrophica WOR_2 bacterium RIFCSPHIGHO2_02_FULL_48_11]OGX33128.1 MAG: hypothetical protein A2787_06380 [Omnitrophica WOR_2 bacterium RIFCSPHIGHO2_01_FULL_48_9]
MLTHSKYTPKKKALLGELLVQRNIINYDQLQTALEKQKELHQLLGRVLLDLGFINHEHEILPVVAYQYDLPYIELKDHKISTDVLKTIPVRIVKRYQVIPVSVKEGKVVLAMNNPFDVLLRDEIQMQVEETLAPVLASRKEITDSIRKYYGVGAETIQEIILSQDNKLLVSRKEEEILDLEKSTADATIGNFLNKIFLQAFQERATDIHIEPYYNGLSIRYRVDGMLSDVNVPASIKFFKESINSRIKIMANLDISERRVPQDGRFRLKVGDIELDMRVSFLPSTQGESAVIRILNSSKIYSFDELNLNDAEKGIFHDLIRKPHGVVFITGPTGSGKTTTLYSCLSCLNTIEKKIITIEDPVEYQLKGATQIQVNMMTHMTFAKGLRSILRHDPNVIMVGEVRDVETAEIAIQAALTGHLIFSTLHTNDAAGGVARLLNMGIEPYLVTSTVECFIAQRLVRLICPKCKTAGRIDMKHLADFRTEVAGVREDTMVYHGKGCEHCNSTGYYGRTVIFEFLFLNKEVSELIVRRASAVQIKEQAKGLGMKTLRQSGWEKVVAGLTTPEEVLRVTQNRSGR